MSDQHASGAQVAPERPTSGARAASDQGPNSAQAAQKWCRERAMQEERMRPAEPEWRLMMVFGVTEARGLTGAAPSATCSPLPTWRVRSAGTPAASAQNNERGQSPGANCC